MATFLTGATGFVGGHLARQLVERGDRVRCLVRAGSDRANLDGLPVEVVEGDLLDRRAVERAVRGCGQVFHCAADYRIYVPDPQRMYRVNVEGTRNVLRAAADSGAERVVHTSSVGALGLLSGGRAADETVPVRIEAMIGPYKRSKFLAERVAEEWAAKGLPVVIVNPSTPIGEADRKPTATGRMILDFLNRRVPVYVDTGLNLVDVRDVARGHLLAAERGRIGEKYILGAENLDLIDIYSRLGRIAGLAPPRLRVPLVVPWTAAVLGTGIARVLGRTPPVAIDAVRMARHKMFFDSSKARDALGYSPGSVDEALSRAAGWFRGHGYVR